MPQKKVHSHRARNNSARCRPVSRRRNVTKRAGGAAQLIWTSSVLNSIEIMNAKLERRVVVIDDDEYMEHRVFCWRYVERAGFYM